MTSWFFIEMAAKSALICAVALALATAIRGSAASDRARVLRIGIFLLLALPALWVGLLYDQGALDAAWDLVKGWTMEERETLRSSVPKLALDAPIPGGGRLRDIAGEVLDIAHAGLAAREHDVHAVEGAEEARGRGAHGGDDDVGRFVACVGVAVSKRDTLDSEDVAGVRRGESAPWKLSTL